MGKKKRRRQLFTLLHNGWIDDWLPILTEAELKVYISIASHADWNTGRSWPSFRTIAYETGLHYGEQRTPNRKRIRAAIHGLERKGLITAEFRPAHDANGNPTNRSRYFYKLTYVSNREYIKG